MKHNEGDSPFLPQQLFVITSLCDFTVRQNEDDIGILNR